MSEDDEIYQCLVSPGLVIRLCKDCREHEGTYKILEKDILGECQGYHCRNNK